MTATINPNCRQCGGPLSEETILRIKSRWRFEVLGEDAVLGAVCGACQAREVAQAKEGVALAVKGADNV